MNPCKCGNSNYSTLYISNVATYGHGDSTHECFIECGECSNHSKKVGGYGLYSDADIKEAIKDWNEKNPRQ